MAGPRLGLDADGHLIVNSTGIGAETGLGTDPLAWVQGVSRKTIPLLLVRNMFSVPFELVAAPGAGFITVVNRIVISKAAGTAFGGVAAAEDLTMQYETSAVKVVGDIETTGFLDASVDEIRLARPFAAASGLDSIDLTDSEDEAIEISLLVGNITGGSDLIVHTYFERFPVALT